MEVLNRETELEIDAQLDAHNSEQGENVQISSETKMFNRILQNQEGTILKSNHIKEAVGYDKVKSSSSVKSLLCHVDNYEAAMESFVVPDNVQQIAEMNGRVFAYMQFMEKYLIKKALGYSKKGKKYAGMMDVCAKSATKIRTQMNFVNKIMERAFEGDQEVLGKKYVDLLKVGKSRIYKETDQTKRTKLGHGNLNTVYKEKDRNEGNRERVFKEGSMQMDVRENDQNEIYARMKMERYKRYDEIQGWRNIGTNEQKEEFKQTNRMMKSLNSAHRDVAVSMIDRLFQLNAVVKTSLAISQNDKKSSMMDLASGKDLEGTFAYMGEENKAIAQVLMGCDKYASRLKYGAPNQDEEKKGRQVVNIASDKFIESTYNMAALDIIVGHVDRHGGNIMVTEDGVKGIDNDTSFTLAGAWGETSNFKQQDNDGLTSAISRQALQNETGEQQIEVFNDGQAKLYFNTAFPVVPKSFQDKICNVSEDAVRGALKGLLEEPEIEACINRLNALKAYLDKAKKVDSFSDISKTEYALERNTNRGIGRFAYGNIMSQVYGTHLDFTNKAELGELVSSAQNSNEGQVLRDYVKERVRKANEGERKKYKTPFKYEDAVKVAMVLFQELTKKISNYEGEFYTLVDQTFDEIVEEGGKAHHLVT